MKPASTSSRRAPWIGAASATVALTALGQVSAVAQVIGGMGQRGGGAPIQSAPVANQPPVNRMSPGSVYRPPQSYPQPTAPQQFTNRSPVFPSVPPNRVFRPGASGNGGQSYGNGTQIYGGGQSQTFGSGAYPSSLPNNGYRTLPSPGSRGARSGQGQDGDTDGQGNRFYSNQLRRPISPRQAPVPNGDSNFLYSRSVRVTTPTGQRSVPYREYNNYIYAPVTVFNGASLLGGYYYGNYSNTYYANGPCYPSVYSSYPGFPEYIVNPGVIVLSEPYYPTYTTPYQPFYAPVYQVTNNQNNYYVSSEDRVQQVQDGGETATRALKNAYPADSYQAAFADIQQAWKTGDIGLLRKHIRDSDTTLSVYFKGKYSYSIASNDFVKITRDAFDRLSTASFEFTRLRKAKNGDITAYGKHVYQTAGSSDTSGDGAGAGNTVPFSTDGPQTGDDSRPYDRADDPAAGAEKTIYVSYTLRKHDSQWSIIGVDSSPFSLVK